jgi:hypothetical protein
MYTDRVASVLSVQTQHLRGYVVLKSHFVFSLSAIFYSKREFINNSIDLHTCIHTFYKHTYYQCNYAVA